MKKNATERFLLTAVVIALIGCFIAGRLLRNSASPESDPDKEEIYETAVEYLQNKNYDSAIDCFQRISNYRNSEELLLHALKMRDGESPTTVPANVKPETNEDAAEETSAEDVKPDPLFNAGVGAVVTLGSYELDGLDNGPEGIPWIVVYRAEDKVLAVSQYVIEEMQFSSSQEEIITWNDSNLKSWLNGNFYNTAFTKEEKAQLAPLQVDFSGEYVFEGGSETDEHVFLLSTDETYSYLGALDAFHAQASGALRKRSASVVDSDGRINYWTRSTSFASAGVTSTTWTDIYNFEADSVYGVRPAIWISLS